MSRSTFMERGRPGLWSRLLRLRLHRIAGRSHACRQADAWLRRRLAAAGGTPRLRRRTGPRQVTGAPPAEAAADLRAAGVHRGLRLEGDVVAEIRGYALAAPCRCASGAGRAFRIAELRDGHTPDGLPVAVADVDGPATCPAVEALSLDALLLETAELWLGYPPARVIPRLFWSPASLLPGEQRRRRAQTVDFHYDIDPARSLYVYFYLTPTDRSSGAHVVLPTTHRRKPISIALASAFQRAGRLRALYPGVRPLVIEGGPGFGFVEDPACFHKALPPRSADRLCLQLRYS